MLDVRMVVDTSQLDQATRDIMAGMKRLPTGVGAGSRNPLVQAMLFYRANLVRKWWPSRPTVGRSGSMAGNAWPKHPPMYERKDGTKVPVWGGVARVRVGRVTRARDPLLGATQRKRKGTTTEEMAAGYGAVRLGQTFTGPVKGKLRGDGTRYERGDKQLGGNKGGNKQGMLQDFATVKPEIAPDGKTVRVSSQRRYAAKIADRRLWHWSAEIGRVVGADFAKRCGDYVVALAKGKK